MSLRRTPTSLAGVVLTALPQSNWTNAAGSRQQLHSSARLTKAGWREQSGAPATVERRKQPLSSLAASPLRRYDVVDDEEEEEDDDNYYAAHYDGEMTSAADGFRSACDRLGVRPCVGFVGGGNMARAMAKGFVGAGLLPANAVGVSEPQPEARQACQDSGFRCVDSSADLLSDFADGVLILAVKPHVLPVVAEQCAGRFDRCRLIVSILAGVKIETVVRQLGLLRDDGSSMRVPVVRVMPNTPALVGCGASVFALGPHCDEGHAALMHALLSTVGTCDQVPEEQVDAVCGLSGSGPAFVYTVIDAMADGGVKMGLPRPLALKLAAQTVVGAGRMVLSTGSHPGALKDSVCSPAGTTIAGVHALEDRGARPALIAAVEAAVNRARELGEKE